MPESRTVADQESHDQAPHQRRLYSVPEAAEQLGGITERMMWTLIGRKDIKSIKVGSRRMVPAESLDAYIHERLEAAA